MPFHGFGLHGISIKKIEKELEISILGARNLVAEHNLREIASRDRYHEGGTRRSQAKQIVPPPRDAGFAYP
ncbi:helix-turn-helix domain-containing protein [Brucella sp. IR073]|uniref:helix-turn-helix domain-containing protein n=1 Tax=unclassified Brucella TaxID=2632610 RepID=UPI003B980BCB